MKKSYTFLMLGCLFLFPALSISQITFTIDSAIVNGGTVTETKIHNGHTYQLVAVHGSNSGASLYNNGGNDLMFYSFGARTVDEETWTIGLLKNGNLVNFNLLSIGYVSFNSSSTTFDVTNQSGMSINNSYVVAANTPGDMVPDTPANAVNISGFIIRGTSFGATMMVDFHNIVLQPDFPSVGISEKGALANGLFPNPTSNFTTIQFKNPESKTISLYSIHGAIMHQERVGGFQYQMDVSHLSTGIYLIEIQQEDQVQTLKMVKE